METALAHCFSAPNHDRKNSVVCGHMSEPIFPPDRRLLFSEIVSRFFGASFDYFLIKKIALVWTSAPEDSIWRAKFREKSSLPTAMAAPLELMREFINFNLN